MKLKALQAKLKAISDRMAKLVESDASLTDSDQIEFDALNDEFEATQAEITAEKKRLAEDQARRERVIAVQQAAALAQPARITLPDDPVPTRIEPVAPAGFKSFGEQLQAIAAASINGHRDQRLQWSSLAPSGAGESSPSDGGFLVQKDFVADMQKAMFDTGSILSRCRRIPIGANSNGLKLTQIDETSRATGSRWGGVQVYWANEGDSATAKKPKFRQADMTLKKVIGLCYATDELLADAVAMEAVMRQAFTEELTFAVEDAIVNGTGAGMPLGFLNAPAKVKVSKEGGQSAATILYANVLKMWARCHGRSRLNAVWLINQDIEPQLHSIANTGNNPIFLPPGGLSVSPYATLFGRPLLPVEYCATLGTEGDIILADLSQYVLIDKGGVVADSSMHVKFISDEMTFRFIYRVDGQPTWSNAITPYKGSNSQSPFITLESR